MIKHNTFRTAIYKKTAELSENEKGAGVIEFAILLPAFMLLLLGVMEFGMYFVKDEIANSAINTISTTIQQDPTYYNSLSTSQLNSVLQSYGAGIVDFSKTPNYICVDPFPTVAQANAALASGCTNTHFNTTNPNGAGNPYYVAVRSSVQRGTITPMGNFIRTVNNMQVQRTSGSVTVGPLIPPKCDKAGEVLRFDGTNWICDNFYQTCAQPWKQIEFNGGVPSCPDVPYEMAGGLASPSSFWLTDTTDNDFTGCGGSNCSKTRSLNNHDYTVCDPTMTWSIPSGLPSPGQIIIEGNLVYPNSDGSWHYWVASFEKLRAPVSGPTGSTEVCISNGGNWVNGNANPKPTIGTERISWIVTYIPN